MAQSIPSETGTETPRAPGESTTPVVPVIAPGGWSTRRALTTGGLIGAVLGTMFWGSYAGTSVWICSGLLTCGHWFPITLVAVIGLAATILVAMTISFVLLKIYRMSRVV
jgi:hypothetical protein